MGGVLQKADWSLLTSKWNKKREGEAKKKKTTVLFTYPALWECGPSQFCGCPPTVHKGFCKNKKNTRQEWEDG